MAERKPSKAKAEEETAAEKPASSESAASEAAPLQAPQAPPVQVDVTRKSASPAGVTPHAFVDATSRLLDADDNEISVDDLFDYPTQDRPGTVVTVRQRVYREYTRPGESTATRQLMYPAGATLSIFEAERVKAEHRQHEQARQAAAGQGDGDK